MEVGAWYFRADLGNIQTVFLLCPGWIQSDQILIQLVSRSILLLPQGRQSLLRFLQFSHYFTRPAIPSWGLPVPRMRAQPKQRPVGVHSSQCKQISSGCLGGGWGQGGSCLGLCYVLKKKKRQKIWVTNHKLFCFRHNWHKQAFSSWFLAGRGLGWLGLGAGEAAGCANEA